MRSILLIAFIALVGNSAQAQWYPVTSGTTENLYDIVFLNEDVGYCGGYGVILQTTDGGENWTTIFSRDSFAIRSICIVSDTSKEKLYAFARKGSSSYLVSTVLSSSPLKWSVTQIPYGPGSIYGPPKVQVYNDAMYFIDDIRLKKLKDDSLSTVVPDVSIFDINKHGLLFVSEETPEGIRIYFSEDHGMTVDTLSPHPSIFGPNQLTNAQAR
ncbi:MAG: hypothetical protein J4G05_10660, partial [Chlorobi bacterium]|nr:hypothetical protein [Chlorobiota bacterium]